MTRARTLAVLTLSLIEGALIGLALWSALFPGGVR